MNINSVSSVVTYNGVGTRELAQSHQHGSHLGQWLRTWGFWLYFALRICLSTDTGLNARKQHRHSARAPHLIEEL